MPRWRDVITIQIDLVLHACVYKMHPFFYSSSPCSVLCWLLYDLHTRAIYIIYFLTFEYVRDMRLFNVGCVFCSLLLVSIVFFSRGVAVNMNSVRKSAMSAIWCGTKCGLNYFNISDGFIISVFRCCNDRKITSVRIFMYNLAFLNSWNTVPS